MATPFPFTTGQVLTAAQMNAITELIINDKTDSYTLVAGDAGEYVVMNKSTSTTITVPNNVFSASQIVRIVNKGAGVCTVTAGSGTTVSTTGSLALAQNATGTLIALSASAFIFEAGGVTAASGALTYLTGATFTSQTTVAFANDVFTATYANYLVLFESTGDSAQRNVSLQVRDNAGTKTAANYFGGSYGVNQVGTGTAANSNGATSFGLAANSNNDLASSTIAITVFNPQISTKKTTFSGSGNVITGANTGSFSFGGQYNVQETHTGLTFTFSAASTGLYRVYGYANS